MEIELNQETGRTVYSDTFFDATMDGPVNVWGQMFEYARDNNLIVDVESIRFAKVYSQMAGEERKIVGFKMIGVLDR